MTTLTAAQISTLKSIGLFNEERYASNVECEQAPSYEELLFASKMIFGGSSDIFSDEEEEEMDFDEQIAAFEEAFPEGDFEIVCICLECA